MKNLYFSSDEFDKNASENFGLSEKILMENAASKIEIEIRKKLKKHRKILALIGNGNNAADGICALRRLSGDFKCYALFLGKKSNEMLEFQMQIAKKVGMEFIHLFEISDEKYNDRSASLECNEISHEKLVKLLNSSDCIVDAVFGSGFHGDLSPQISYILHEANKTKALKIAVDVPSGLRKNGSTANEIFKADITVTMGALKLCLYSDMAKDFVGRIKCANLGICEQNFTKNLTQDFLLTKKDLVLPCRNKQNTNKGDFGHVFVSCGDMSGAAEIAGLSAHAIGAGLVSIVSDKELKISPLLMQKKSLNGAKIVVIGCGLGKVDINFNELTDKICVIDADMFYKDELSELLKTNKNMVLTPHPKEFRSLLKICGIGEFSVSEIQNARFEFARNFSLKFPQILVLKGANTIIAYNGKLYIMPLGSSKLAKGGSGDALAGIIAGFIAQGYEILNAAINGVLAHALSVENCKKNDYSINAFDIVDGLKWLRKK